MRARFIVCSAIAGMTAIAVPIPRLATIADADPQVTAALRLVRWAGLKLATDDVTNLRLTLMAILPNIAGLVLAFGTALRRGQPVEGTSARDGRFGVADLDARDPLDQLVDGCRGRSARNRCAGSNHVSRA